MSGLLEKAEKQGLRGLAKKLDRDKDGLRQSLKQLGFRQLTDYTRDSCGGKNSVSLNYELDKMQMKKIQGIFGEKIATFVEGKLIESIKSWHSEDWQIREGVKLRTSSESPKTAFYGIKPDEEESFKCTGHTVAHRGMDIGRIRKRLESKHFHTSRELFEKFQRYQVPNIDNVFYAMKTSGEKKEQEYRVIDWNTGGYGESGEKLVCELDIVEDFKIIGVEVKTTRDEGEKLLSKNQRKVKERSSETAFLDFYILRVNYDVRSREIPEEVEIEMRKL